MTAYFLQSIGIALFLIHKHYIGNSILAIYTSTMNKSLLYKTVLYKLHIPLYREPQKNYGSLLRERKD